MNNLPYFFLLLKRNIGLWTLIATGSFSKIDTAHMEYPRMSPYVMTLKNYSLSEKDTFKEISILSGHGEVSVDFITSNSKYQDSMKYYFGTSSISGSMSGGYTIGDTTINNSINALGPIDIGLDRKVDVFLGRPGEHEYKISLMLQANNHWQLSNKFMDSIRMADSAMYGLRGQPPPYLERLKDSALFLGFDGDKRLSDDERKQLASRSIEIINKAIKADSTYLDAYELKFGWETELKRYNSLIVTGKKILKLTSGHPEAEVPLRMGESYELTNNIDSAKAYYQRALLLYDQRINEMNQGNASSDYEMSYKALVLILLNRGQEGRGIFKQLSENTMINKFERQLYQEYFVTPRSEFLQKLKP